MRQLLAAVAACLMLGSAGNVTAQDRVGTQSKVTGWEAVGRLNIAGRNMCTGALIAPNLVLTAAHCLYDPSNGRAVDPTTIRFEAGLDGRYAKAARGVAKAVLHPQYRYRPPGKAQIGHDLAVLRLDRPISSEFIQPFATSSQANRGDAVGVMSYNYVERNRPNWEQPCHVIARKAQTLVMNCTVDFGASGAPVFEVRPGRAPRLISVISAKAAMGNQRVSIGTALDKNLWELVRRAG
ncbi:trypsin-like serine peptidase [Epibacterium ulvae]|uniref:V8-like Glu-specific endopeptidase n=1 Tax=Epibacterium ulvae TaxID=1156985 RepID=A0A1G5PNM8_9RHOB|nr:trypsin-like serine protease [Epibacterium ulvae]SCZ51083.1 V8-like Glu-specific endopeptidase [Epibacterium ulvae]